MELDIITLISNFGFPIAMVMWFMLRTEKIIQRNTEAMEKVAMACSLNHGGKK